MNKVIFNIIIMMVASHGIIYCQFEESNPYSYNAMTDAVMKFTQIESLSKERYWVLTMKIIELRKKNGEFVLSYFRNFNGYDALNPSHYLYLDNRLVLIVVEPELAKKLTDYGIQPTSDSIKVAAGKHLAGPHPSIPGLRMSITGQTPPMMVVKYRRNRVQKELFDRKLPDRKYWF